jgi:hypothetical protein
MTSIPLEKIKNLIAFSKLLQPDEKTTWLESLPVMNDKQLSDLVTILSAPSSSVVIAKLPETPQRPKPGPISAVLKPVASAPLTANRLHHITNLPNNLGAPQQTLSSQVKTFRHEDKGQATGAFAKNLAQVMTEKELESGQEDSAHQLNSPARPSIATAPLASINARPNLTAGLPLVKAVLKPMSSVHLQKVVTKQTDYSALLKHSSLSELPQKMEVAKTNFSSEVPLELKSLEDVEHLNRSTVMSLGKDDLLEAMRSLVKKFGYFSVLFLLEKSPLYEEYMKAGKQALMHSDPNTTANLGGMSKTDFEAVIDVLRATQVN